jgi:hypothetical protein
VNNPAPLMSASQKEILRRAMAVKVDNFSDGEGPLLANFRDVD